MLGVVAFVLAVMCKQRQHLPTILAPAVHRVKTLETMCNARERPQQCWRSCVNGSNIVALRFGNRARKGLNTASGAQFVALPLVKPVV